MLTMLFHSLRLLLALFVATQLWAWLFYLLGIWITGNWSEDIIELMFFSIGTQVLGLKALIYLVIPVFLIYFAGLKRQRAVVQLSVLVGLGMCGSLLFHLYVWGAFGDPVVMKAQRLLVLLLSGAVSGFVAWSLLFVSIRRRDGARTERGIPTSATRRRFVAYLGSLLGTLAVLGSSIGPYRIQRNASKHLDIDVARMQEGQMLVVEFNQSPVWIIKRTDAMLAAIANPPQSLYDPDSKRSIQPEAARNTYRAIDPRYFVAYGICTHLGCSPKYLPAGQADGHGPLAKSPQLFCPCHNGVFDLAGRVYAGLPPPRNLDIPNYAVIGTTIRLYYPGLVDAWRRSV